MITVDEFPGREIEVGGKKFLYFGGTSYLGLQVDAEFQSQYIEQLKKYGTGYGASRKSNIQLAVFEKTESYLTQLVGSEAGITLSSGYLAGQLLCEHFSNESFQRYYAPNTHSALYRGAQSIYENWTDLERDLIKNKDQVPVVLLDSIDFYGMNYPNYRALENLPLHRIILIVDDSHGINITGTDGGGSFRYLQSLKPKELLVSCSLGKGFGIQAGAIFGNELRIKHLRNTALFGGASPAAPASLATLASSHHLYGNKRKALKENTELFLSLLEDTSMFIFTKGHPCFSFQNEVLAKQLENYGILTTNFRYPTTNDNLMSRIVISANHTKGDIKKLCDILQSMH